MFIDRLVNQGNTPLLEKMLSFTEARARLIGENVANISVPGYRTKDISMSAFQKKLRERVAHRDASGNVKFDDIVAQIDQPGKGIVFHDKNNRSIEQIMTDMSSNGLRHNMYVELLRKQYNSIQSALKERVE
ncbi:MAG: hypothetical protein QM770_07835 [Tepidisphaeraceae bacterium]